jgi:hypothetical protein
LALAAAQRDAAGLRADVAALRLSLDEARNQPRR